MFIAVQRSGPVRAVPVRNEKVSELQPIIDKYINKDSHLMTDGHRSFLNIGQQFSKHSTINHSDGEYSRGNIHNNTAESFSALLERAKVGVFHYLSKKHLSRYLNEFEFRWINRIPEEKKTKTGKKKIVMKPIPVINMITKLIIGFSGILLRRTSNWGIYKYVCT